jgi:hypothetical protein
MAQLLGGQLKEQAARLNSILTNDLAEFNRFLRAENIPSILGAPVNVPQGASSALRQLR